MSKIGIFVLSTKYNGGAYQYAQSIIDALIIDKTHQYVLFSSEENKQFDNVKIQNLKIPTKIINKFQTVLAALSYCSKINISKLIYNKIDVSIFKDISLFIIPHVAPFYIANLLKFIDKKFIVTIHDLQEKYYPNFFTLKDKIIRYLNNGASANYSSHILCESKYVKSDIIKYLGVNENKISIITSPPPQKFLEIKNINENFANVKKKYGLPDNYIFYPAQFWIHKNHLKLLEAFKIIEKKIDNFYLVLTGAKQYAYDTIIKKIKDLNLEDKVILLGYVDYEDLPAIYKLSKLLVMPTLFESVSIPIYEAFALKVPVCASNLLALPEQVGDAGLLFDPHDPNDIAEKMTKLIVDEKLCYQFKENGYNKVKNFNHINYSSKLVNIINQLI